MTSPVKFDRERALALLGPFSPPPLEADVALGIACSSNSHSPTRLRRDRLPAMESLMAWLGSSSSESPQQPAPRGSSLAPSDQDELLLTGLLRGSSVVSALTDDDYDEALFQQHRSISSVGVFDREAAMRLLLPTFDREAALMLLAPASNAHDARSFDRAAALRLLLPSTTKQGAAVVEEDRDREAAEEHEELAETAEAAKVEQDVFDREAAVALLAPSRSMQCAEHKRRRSAAAEVLRTSPLRGQEEEEEEGTPSHAASHSEHETEEINLFDRESAVALLAPSRLNAVVEFERRCAELRFLMDNSPLRQESKETSIDANPEDYDDADEVDSNPTEQQGQVVEAKSEEQPPQQQVELFDREAAIALLAPSRVSNLVSHQQNEAFRLLLPTVVAEEPPPPPAPSHDSIVSVALPPPPSPAAAIEEEPQHDDEEVEAAIFDRESAIALLAPSRNKANVEYSKRLDAFRLLLPAPSPPPPPPPAGAAAPSPPTPISIHEVAAVDDAESPVVDENEEATTKQAVELFDREAAISLLAPSRSGLSSWQAQKNEAFRLLMPSPDKEKLHPAVESVEPEPREPPPPGAASFDREAALKLLSPHDTQSGEAFDKNRAFSLLL